MTRPITPAAEAESLKLGKDVALFAELEFDPATLRLWTGIGPIAWNGQTWQGVGVMGRIGGVNETMEIRAAGATMELSGLNSDLLAAGLNEHYQNRPARVWLAFLDAGGQVIADPVLIFANRMDVMEVDDQGDTSTIRLTTINNLIDLRRARAWRYTDQDQQQLFPGDTSLRFVARLQNKEIVWG